MFWPRKIMSLFTYLRPLQKRVISPPNDCWICHDASDSVVLPITNFSLISNASVSLEQTQPSLYYVRLLNPMGLFPCLWLITTNPRKLAFRLYTKKGTQCKGNQNETTSVVTGLYGCQLSSPEPQSQMRITKRHS